MMAAEKMTDAHILHSHAFASFQTRLRPDADLSKTNWFRAGGRAEFLFKPESTQDLSAFLTLLPPEIRVTILGVGSNVIIRDGGIDGVVVKLGRGFTELSVEGDRLTAIADNDIGADA